jgi:flagellar FliJ protein
MQPLMTLLAQAERERDTAMSDAQRSAQSHQAAVEQAEQLLVYRREYEQRWSTRFQSEGRIELVHCYRAFTDRLTQAVEQQQRVVQHASAQLERMRITLAEHEMRVASVRTLIERRATELRLSADRVEQKQADEFGARMAWSTPTLTLGLGLPRNAV